MRERFDMRIKIFILTALVIFLSACSTPYQPLGLGGGYSDMPLNQNTYKVSFRGNGYTSTDKVQNLLLHRCADLTNEKGYNYFIILTGNATHQDSQFTTPTTVSTSGYSTGNGYGQMNTNYNGNQAYGNYSLQTSQFTNTQTTVTQGQTYTTSKYTHTVIIRLLKDNKQFPDAIDAKLVLNSINNK